MDMRFADRCSEEERDWGSGGSLQRYYIYQTTDGAHAQHNHDFKCFSQTDLVNWKDEGVILDLYDVDWGKEYAWVPCITEKKVDDGYKYNFVANKNIGVAVVDKPEGPYHDALGRALLTKEEIDAPNQVIILMCYRIQLPASIISIGAIHTSGWLNLRTI